MALTLRVFTHPACPRCGGALRTAWRCQEDRPGLFELRTVSLVDKAGLEEAHAENVKTIPTLILSKDGEEVDRIVGAPAQGQLENSFDKLTAGQEV